MEERFKIVKSWLHVNINMGLLYVYIQKMKSYIDILENLDVWFSEELAIDMVLNSLSSLYH